MSYPENFLSHEVDNTEPTTKTKIKDLKNSIKSGESNTEEKDFDVDFIKNLSNEDLQKSISISKNWEVLVFWYPLWYFLEKWVFITPDLLKEKERLSKQTEKKELLLDIVEIWTEKAMNIKSEMWLKSFRNDDDFIQRKIDEIYKILQDINIPMSDDIFNNLINYIFKQFEMWENISDIIWVYDMYKVRELFFDDKLDREQKLVSIFEQMRYRWLTWNSATIKDKLSNELLSKDDFKSIRDLLFDDSVIDLIKIWDSEWFKLALSWIEFESETKKDDFVTEVMKNYQNIKTKIEKLNENWEILENINKYRIENWQQLLEKEEFIEMQISESFMTYMKYSLIKNKVSMMHNRESEKTLTWLYADMIWLWEKKTTDWINLEDENIDTIIEIWSWLVIWVMTMWAWSLAVKWWHYFVEIVNTWIRLDKISKAWKWAKLFWWWIKWLWNNASRLLWRWVNGFEEFIATKYPKLLPQLSNVNTSTWKFIWNSILDWVTFHEGATLMSNLIYKEIDKIWEWTTNLEDIMKSIVFMWTLNWLNYVSKIPWYEKIESFSQKIPNNYLSKKAVEDILKASWMFTTWWFIYSISWTIDKAFWEWWNPTVKEYLEFVALLAIFQKIHK